MVKGCCMKEIPQFSIVHAEALEKFPCYLWWPREAMNIKVASRCFNLSNTFLNMVFKHFGNEKEHNRLDWSSYFLSQLSSWASPSGLAKFQKQTLYSCIPVSLLAFATVTSDSLSLSCLHLIKICSSRETVTSPFLPYAHPKNRHWTRDSVPISPYPTVLIFMTGDSFVSAKQKGNWWTPLSSVLKRKNKSVCSWYLSEKMNFKLVLSCYLGENKQQEKKPEISASKTLHLSSSSLWTSVFFTPNMPSFDSQAMIRCIWKGKEDPHLHGFQQKRTLKCKPSFLADQ